jgi:acetolactate synthase-1/2/3 large subunit
VRISGAEIITQLLERQGVEIVTGIPGGTTLPLYDTLAKSRLVHVLARHEQGAGFIAQGMARATGKAAVCLATSGPGATNVITAIADAKLDSIPTVFITGQVSKALIGTDAFQEVDTYGLTVPIAKHNYLVRSAAELLEVIPEAFTLAESGRPGPVVIDVPKDVQQEIIELEAWPEPGARAPAATPTEDEIQKFAALIAQAERPMLYIGGGVIASNASAQVIRLAEQAGIPVTMSLHGLGAFPAGHPLALGMLGMHGARHTSMLLDEADLLIALGARFDDRATGKISEFCEHATVVHVDIDRSEIHKLKAANLGIVADVAATLDRLLATLPSTNTERWRQRVAELKRRHPLPEGDTKHAWNPAALVREIAARAEAGAIVTTDVGQHQMWVAQHYPFRRPRTLLSSGGLGTMGFGLPAAIGAALAKPDTQIICFTGDGSLLMNIQELATLAETGCNVKIILFNNQQLGLVRQQQELFYGGRFHAAHFASQPDFASIARGFGIPGIDLGNGAGMDRLAEVLASPGPALVNVPISGAANVLPMVPPGAANRNMIERTLQVSHA